MNKNPKLTFYSGVGTVTGANFLLESVGGTRVLIDCGIVQGDRVATEENHKPWSYDPASIDVLFITHAHLDHVGRIPKLVKDGFKGVIYSTPETKALAEIILNDAVGILTMEAKQEGLEPLYNIADVQEVFPLWKTIEYHEAFKISDDLGVFLKDAGHILGSSMIEFTTSRMANENSENTNSSGEIKNDSSKIKILFTGDLGNSPAPLLRDTEPVGEVDYIVMESVYGDRNHESREGRDNKLEQVIKDSISRGGTLVIPAFSVDRTQILLYELNNMVEQKKIPSVPVFVDSPMAIKATQIYAGSEEFFNDRVREQIRRGDDIFKFPHLEFTMSSAESRDIENIKGAKIILAGSGMSIGGRVISHERHYLSDEKSTILLVGYQSAGSLGRELADGHTKVVINRETVKVKAHIETIYGYSAHKDGDHLLEFVTTATDSLKEVFVVMGEPRSSMHLAQRINDEIGKKAIVPEIEKTFELV